MIEIVQVKTKKQQKEFIEFPLNLYKGNKNFVPPLYMDEKEMFKPNCAYYEQSESIFFSAYQNGKIVGRIQGILQKASNEKWQQKRIRFTRFDAIDSQEVASALFDAIEKWAKEKNMEEISGPLGFTDLDREGLLIEGFDELSTFEEQYNFPYYQKLIENEGFVKEVDWVERKLYYPDQVDERIKRLSQKMLDKYNLKIAKCKNTKEFIKRYGDKVFDIIDETYKDIYGSVPITERIKKSTLASFNLVVNIKNVAVVVDEQDNVICFGISLPSIAKAVQKSGGRLTLPTIFRILKAVKKPKIIDLCLIGVVKEYRMKGVSTILIAGILDMLNNKGVEYAETNLNLEDNLSIQNQWKNFKNILHKRRRCFIKKIKS